MSDREAIAEIERLQRDNSRLERELAAMNGTRERDMTPKKKRNLARVFAKASISAGVRRLGPETNFAPRWYPRLAGRWVRNSDDPPNGFETRKAGCAAAERYRDSCRRALNTQSEPG